MRTTSIAKGRRFGILAVAAALAGGPAIAGAAGGGSTQRDREVRERARAEVRALFDSRAEGGYIGVQVRDIEAGDEIAGAAEGAVVTEVVEGDPAATAGIEAGDILVEFDGERIRGVRQLARVVRETPAGRSVAATVLRDGARATVNVTPRERSRPDRRAILRRAESPEWADRHSALRERLPDIFNDAFAAFAGRPHLGIRGVSVDGQLAGYFGVSAGVLVRRVEEDTVAAAAGLRAGDVITAIDGVRVEDLGALRRRLSALDSGASFEIAVMRAGAAMSLQAELAEEAEPRPRGLRRGVGI